MYCHLCDIYGHVLTLTNIYGYYMYWRLQALLLYAFNASRTFSIFNYQLDLLLLLQTLSAVVGCPLHLSEQ